MKNDNCLCVETSGVFCKECQRLEDARKKYPEYKETREVVSSCLLCSEVIDNLLVLSNRITRPVLTVEGKDVTNEFFRLLGIVRRTIKNYQ